ncbi:hypothetical protein M947_06665 [Sulfurimonas hongkongensis]|uniref:Uncharacterized protein n=1 Tax=Sulfurimonas hongkongensis TaxID=1172190 RepID=T0JS30_9BACT|nr:hypothetical protein M947_06665 [Sulfurimonas hongkongensis]
MKLYPKYGFFVILNKQTVILNKQTVILNLIQDLFETSFDNLNEMPHQM